MSKRCRHCGFFIYTEQADLARQGGMAHWRSCEPKRNWPVFTPSPEISTQTSTLVEKRVTASLAKASHA